METDRKLSVVCEQQELDILGVGREFRPQLFQRNDGQYEMVIEGQKTAKLMLKYQNLSIAPSSSIYYQETEYIVTLMTSSEDTVAKVLKLRVIPRNCVVHRTFHFQSQAGESLSMSIPYNKARLGDVNIAPSAVSEKFVRSTQDVEHTIVPHKTNNLLVKLSHRAEMPRESTQFYVALFNDSLLHDLCDVWRISIDWE